MWHRLMHLVLLLMLLTGARITARAESDAESILTATLFSPDDTMIAGSGITVKSDGSFEDFIYVWDVKAGFLFDLNTAPEGHRIRIISISWSPDSRYLVSGAADGKAIVWEIKNADGRSTGLPLKTLDTGLFRSACAEWNHRGNEILTSTYDYRFAIWNTTTYTLARADFSSPLRCARWSPDDSRIASGGQSGIILMGSDLNTPLGSNARYPFLLEPEGPDQDLATGTIAWSPDGAMLAVVYAFSSDIQFRDVSSGTIIDTIENEAYYPQSIQWNPDGQRLATATNERVDVWDIRTKSILATYTMPDKIDPSFYVSWSSDGKQLVYPSFQNGTSLPPIVVPPSASDIAADDA